MRVPLQGRRPPTVGPQEVNRTTGADLLQVVTAPMIIHRKGAQRQPTIPGLGKRLAPVQPQADRER